MIKKIFFTLAIFSFYSLGFAIEVPSLNGKPVQDKASLLTSSEVEALTNVIFQHYESGSFQEAILIVPSLEGKDIESYALEVFDAWKLGSSGANNGILILVALQERLMRIEVGYGLEAIVTDAKAGLIIRKLMAPLFQEGRYADGLLAATGAIVDLVQEDGSVVAELENTDETNLEDIITIAILLIIIAFRAWRLIQGVSGFGGGGGFSRTFSGGRGFSGGRSFSGGGGRSGGGGASGRW